jgi:hypothetical protein
VNIVDSSSGPTLVGAIELVSPPNKDRETHRRAFAVKCASYLDRQIGLIVVDVVTSRQSLPLLDLLELVQPQAQRPTLTPLCATSIRPCCVVEVDFLEFLLRPLEVDGVFAHVTALFESWASDGGRFGIER